MSIEICIRWSALHLSLTSLFRVEDTLRWSGLWYQIFPLAAKFMHCRFVRCTCWKSFSAFYATAETRILSAINLSSQISKCTKCWNSELIFPEARMPIVALILDYLGKGSKKQNGNLKRHLPRGGWGGLACHWGILKKKNCFPLSSPFPPS